MRTPGHSLEARLPRYWVPVLGSLYEVLLIITKEPPIWVPGLLGIFRGYLTGANSGLWILKVACGVHFSSYRSALRMTNGGFPK